MEVGALTGLRRRWLGLLALLLVTLGVWTAAAVARADNYVSLGDSYVAGPFIPNPTLPLGCLKSDHNYPHLAAGGIGLPLRDPSCSGATTDDMTQPQDVDPDGPNPPQFNSLDASTTVVSLTIGGNDIGFSSIAEDCVTYNPFSHPCKDKYDSGGVDQISQRIQATAPKVAAVLQGIHQLAPSARVLIVGYPDGLPVNGTGCWPLVPLSPGDIKYFNSLEEMLNSVISQEAASNQATYVDTFTSSIGHDACKPPGTAWVNGIVPTSAAFPLHPNQMGEANMAKQVLAALAG